VRLLTRDVIGKELGGGACAAGRRESGGCWRGRLRGPPCVAVPVPSSHLAAPFSPTSSPLSD
jgi:hypothetical protein